MMDASTSTVLIVHLTDPIEVGILGTRTASIKLTRIYAPRLSVQRLRTLQQKKEAQAKASRRDIASLLERGKEETARIKVESRAYEAPIPFDIHPDHWKSSV
jgi:hypothetical protein